MMSHASLMPFDYDGADGISNADPIFFVRIRLGTVEKGVVSIDAP